MLDGKELKLWAKSWIDANVHDGEDRAGCHADSACFSPDDLQELIDDLVGDIVVKVEAKNLDLCRQIVELEKRLKQFNIVEQ
ncbi:MAG: hypothetical protein KAR42_15600 [candidate division Zixibacteria bacterium]|nr:hypothetical protein [candidate division Zixibacteria bacterium]